MNAVENITATGQDRLLAALKQQSPGLQKLFSEVNDTWGYEDPIYRFYHQSFKVYDLQQITEEIVRALRAVLPDRPLNEWFTTIISEGTGKKFDSSHNQRWLEETRPIVEAFFHARFFLEMAVKYGAASEEVEGGYGLPSGLAALLYLYGLR
jgi:hypothetical protein